MALTMITILHNPRCSKSRETLALLDTLNPDGSPITVIEYLKTPLTAEQLETLHRQLGGSVRDMLRTNEAPYQELGLDNPALSDAQLYGLSLIHI